MSSCETGPAGTAKLIERYPSLQNIVLGLGMTWFDNWSPMPCQIVDEYWIKKLSGRSAHGTVSDTIKEWLPDEDLPRLFIRFFVRHSHGSRNGNRYILVGYCIVRTVYSSSREIHSQHHRANFVLTTSRRS